MNIKESVEKFFGENNVLVDFDLSQENENCYGFEPYVREREESDEDYDWLDEFEEAVDEIVEEKKLRRFRIDSKVDSAADFFYAVDYNTAFRFVSKWFTFCDDDELADELYDDTKFNERS